MAVLVTRNPALFADISCTPALDGGIGPVKIGIPLVEDGTNPRYAACHPFAEIDQAWISAYCSGDTPSVEILDSIPADWRYPAEGETVIAK